MTWPDLKEMINTLGFPLFVALYLLIRGEKIINNHSHTIKSLQITLEGLKTVIDKCKKGGD